MRCQHLASVSKTGRLSSLVPPGCAALIRSAMARTIRVREKLTWALKGTRHARSVGKETINGKKEDTGYAGSLIVTVVTIIGGVVRPVGWADVVFGILLCLTVSLFVARPHTYMFRLILSLLHNVNRSFEHGNRYAGGRYRRRCTRRSPGARWPHIVGSVQDWPHQDRRAAWKIS